VAFDALLEAFFEDPSAEEELYRRYRCTTAILVVDLSSMVARSDAEGVAYALALARRVERRAAPLIARAGGTIIKRVADTWFAVFPEAGPALDAAFDVHRDLEDFNRDRHGHIGDHSRREPIYAGMGLGWGEALLIPGVDIYGEEVNRAFVLGEDVASSRQTLITPAFRAALGGVPLGVGIFEAPQDGVEAAGFAFLVASDYRQAPDPGSP
jgi:class 3 adenylate cyclase